MFANNQNSGTDQGFPDTCLTPTGTTDVPIPYTNTASGSMGIPTVYTVLVAKSLAHNLGTTVSQTNGDSGGTTGVTSGTVMGTSRHNTGANTVLIGGMPVTRMTSVTSQNGTNCVGSRLSPSQTTVLILAG